jgi:hypothetical protein
MSFAPLPVKELPQALPLRKIIGPSFIILGLGLGSGEIILWPYLSSQYGLGIIWGALIGITFQFFMNMEIERYALAHGESIFVGFARKLKWLPTWFVISTFLPWIWPGIAASSAKILGTLGGIQDTSNLAIGFLIVMGLILSLGPVLYKTVENLQKVLITVGVPSIFLLSIFLTRQEHWVDLARGAVGLGDGFFLLPMSIPLASFLAALAYAGAGGNLNLAQSYYVKEKGYGMGKYAGRITSLLTGKVETISLTGSKFEPTPENISVFKQWWKTVNIEHFIVFWLTGSVTIMLLALLSYTTTYGMGNASSDINFLFAEASQISSMLFPFAGTFFLLVAGLTLFGTQLTVFDATSRILSENVILASGGRVQERHLPKVYYTVLWLQILCGIAIFLVGFTQPLQLLTLAAVLNAFAMFIHVGFTLWLNSTSLDKPLRPSAFRYSAMILAFVFYGGFSIYTIVDHLLK